MELFNPFSPYVIGTLLTFIDLVQSRKYSPLTHLKASTHVEKHVLWFYTWRTPTCRMPTIGPLWTSWWFALWNSNFTPFWLFNFYKPFFQRKAAYKYGVWDSERSTISPAFLYDRYYGWTDHGQLSDFAYANDVLPGNKYRQGTNWKQQESLRTRSKIFATGVVNHEHCLILRRLRRHGILWTTSPSTH